jgi:hypothetical protein
MKSRTLKSRTEVLITVGLMVFPLLTIACVEAILPAFELLVDDGPLDYQPPLIEAIGQVLEGRLPLWSDATYCGYPLLARGQPGALYPPHYVAALFATLIGLPDQPLVVSFALHLSMAAALLFILLRSTGASLLGSTVAGAGVALAGPALGICGSWPVLWLFVPWLILSILCVHRFSVLASGPWTALLGICIGMVACSGYPEGMFAFALMLVTSTVVTIHPRMWIRALPRLVAASVLGLAIGASQLLSMGDLVLLGRRAQEWSVQETTSLALQPVHLFGLLAPWMEVPFGQTPRFFPGGVLYAGPWVVLGVLTLLVSWRRWRIGRAAVCCLIVAATLSLGTTIPGVRYLFDLPPLSYFRWPIKHIVEMSVMFALAGAYGLSTLLYELDRRKVEVILWAHFVLQAVAAVTLPRSTVQPTLALGLAIATVAVSLALPLLLRFGGRRATETLLLGTGLVFPILNIPFAADGRIDKIQRPRVVADLPPMETDDRLLLLFDDIDARAANRIGLPAYNLAHARSGVERVLGHDALRPAHYTWLAGIDPAITGNVVDQDEVASWLETNRILPFVRAGLVIIGGRQTRLVEAARVNPFLRQVGTIGEFRLFASSAPRPVAFLAKRVHLVDSAVEAGRAFVGNDSPLEVVHVEGDLQGSGNDLGTGRVQVLSRDLASIELEIASDPYRDSFLVVTSSWYPGWKAVVDGIPAQVHRVNGSFIGVALPVGAGRVSLSYDPAWLPACCAFSGVLLVGTLAFVAWSLRSRARSNPQIHGEKIRAKIGADP